VGSRGTEPSLTPPPLVQADPSPPPDDAHEHTHPKQPRRKPFQRTDPPAPPPDPPKPTQQDPPVPPSPKKRPTQLIPEKPEDYTVWDYLKEDALDTTMKESMPLISKWFGIVGKGLEYVPGLKGVGKAYQGIGKAAEGLQLIY